jgi:hypothetical protein
MTLSREEVRQIRILDQEGNLFFKVVETKKRSIGKTLRPLPFSEAKPKPEKRKRLGDGSSGYVPTHSIVVGSEHIDDHGGCDEQLDGQGVLYDPAETAQPNKR